MAATAREHGVSPLPSHPVFVEWDATMKASCPECMSWWVQEGISHPGWPTIDYVTHGDPTCGTSFQNSLQSLSYTWEKLPQKTPLVTTPHLNQLCKERDDSIYKNQWHSSGSGKSKATPWRTSWELRMTKTD